MVPILLEVHIDEILLRAEPARWDQVAALMDRLAGLAEGAGGRLCFRVREYVVTGDREGFLRGLQRRGHEIGWHCHGDDPGALIQAMRQQGLPATVGTPGLVQAGEQGRLALLERARALGTRRITDRVERRHRAYQGFLPWEPIPGLWSFDTSVSPFDWGVLQRRLLGVRHAHGGLQWDQLDRWIGAWSRLPQTPGLPAFFCAAFHEHNLCRPDSMTVIQPEIDAFARFLDRFGPRLSLTADLPLPAALPPPEAQPEAPAAHLRRRLRHGYARLRPPELRRHTVGLRQVRYRIWAPPAGTPVRGSWLVLHGGKSGLDQLLSFAGLVPADLTARGFRLCCLERGPGDRTPGNPDHLAEARELLRMLLRDGPAGLLSWSGGLVPAARLARELPVRCLVDAEGPVDRFSLIQPRLPRDPLLLRPLADDAAWAQAEALPVLCGLPVPYLRLQGSMDHVHGADISHARRAVAAAGGRFCLWSGDLAGHGMQILEELERAWGAQE